MANLSIKEKSVMNAVHELVNSRGKGILSEQQIFDELPRVGKRKLIYEIFGFKKRAEYMGEKCVDLEEIRDIMESLATLDFFDLVVTDKKGVQMYVVTLLNKGASFERDQRDKRRSLYLIIIRTVLLAILSFIITVILKAIFS